MTIRKRLTLSNIIMIVVPVVITALVGAASLIGMYFAMHNGGISFEESSDFHKTVTVASAEFYEIFEHGTESRKDRVSALGNIINKESMLLVVYEDGKEFYSTGNPLLRSRSAERSAAEFGNKSFISSDNVQLFYYTTDSDGLQYDMYIYNTASSARNHTVKAVFIASVAAIIAAMALSIIFTNRFLIKFVFKKIDEPLNILTAGVNQISMGNLDHRLEYDRNDEFLPVCRSFNDMAERLKRSVELAQKNEENRKELLLDISHDLRTPLTAIQAYVEGLMDGVAQTPEMQRKYLETIKRKTTDIEKMVASLFAYSKLDMEEFETHIEDIGAQALLNEIVGPVKDEYEKNGLNINIAPCEGVRLKADRELMLRVVINLIENSLKYKSKQSGNMLISASSQGGKVILSFEDDGPGVPEDKLDKIFDVFYRTDEARCNTGGGSGIGLAFVKKAVEAMGGRVYAGKSLLGGLAIMIETEEAL